MVSSTLQRKLSSYSSRRLSERLQAKGKELTLDTFAHQWHVPNQTWWPALLPHLDGLHVMGYSETGAGGTGWRGYDFLKAAAGEHHAKLALGMASHKAAWQGAPAMKHLRWIIADESVGLAIWDCAPKGAGLADRRHLERRLRRSKQEERSRSLLANDCDGALDRVWERRVNPAFEEAPARPAPDRT